ncbi:MAG: Ribosome maturation factor RimM [Candidatus Accumulibacter appositus]|uniref:Ribosome maturation factor RimM n=1 Tax=Candidatus Accumulibacter appositus TaxID=1454003 RepID=A0A011PR83_9PROT|nr:ribosome maturation factor RimM [Accumulibacter sp.]EXI79380.1 MAG: Ribosome maturation factor RimM [Candidatus Accumulibacter appositus]HRF03701.1 ribosome maturation factor RimM [Accumulibacter sp.]
MPAGSLSAGTGAVAGPDARPADVEGREGGQATGEIVVLGKIAGPHGLQGTVRVYPFADDPLAWSRLPQWWLCREGEAPDLWRPTRLIKCDLRKEVLLAQLECVADRSAAEAAAGLLVGVPHQALPPTAADEYYWADLLGLAVVNTHGQSLGRILGLIETPANAVLRVGDGQGVDRLLPFVAAVVLEVDLAQARVRVDWEMDW